MPILTTQDLASKFKQNWMEVNPADLLGTSYNNMHLTPPNYHTYSKKEDSENLDDSLTSLNWLQNLRIMKIGQPTPPSSPTPLSVSNQQCHSLPIFTQKPFSNSLQKINFTHDIKPITRTQPQSFPVMLEPIDYKTNGYIKPPYSYATLIWMAMKETKNNKITLSAIYKWIMENFKYYQTAEPSWQNSIRHNLSLNKCFQKVARRKDEPGKGGFWTIDPVHAELLESGILKKRRGSVLSEPCPLPSKYIKVEPEEEEEEVCPPNTNTIELVLEIEKPKVKKNKHRSKKKHKSKKKFRLSALHSLNESMVEEDDNLPSSVLNESFKWDSIFDSEIDVGGTKVKTEHLLDSHGLQRDVSVLYSLTALNSPPHSDENEENDMVFASSSQEVALDLSIKGTHIPKPLWFEVESETDRAVTAIEETMDDLFGDLNLPPSPASSLNDQTTHPWAESKDEEAVDFNFEDLLNFENLPMMSEVQWDDQPLPPL